MIVFLTNDLMMASNASSHAKQHQVAMAQATTVEKTMTIIEENRPHLLLVDLQTPGINIDDLGDQIRKLSDSSTPLTIGFAQHVEVDKIAQAKSAGFDQVLTRGQINAQIGQIVADIA